ncbi:MAG: AAA family ATPase [Candidatus Marinimicrobia bacterium]|nr:AAA family ATPase [Candidatus Neomarinimicrobiota bacterium]
MIFGKYQISGEISQRGYSKTAKVIDDVGNIFFAKWLLGIEKEAQISQMLKDTIRKLKRVDQEIIPKIIEYNWDQEQKAFCIIYENLNAETLENYLYKIDPSEFLMGIEKIINCLSYLLKYKISHGDITPDNIIIDDINNFYLIDFALADTTANLSQTSNLVQFSQKFAAPEKWNRELKGQGHPFQSDIYSIGKVIEWFFDNKGITGFTEIDNLIDCMCCSNPSERLDLNTTQERIKKIYNTINFNYENIVIVEDQVGAYAIEDLNNEGSKLVFKLNPQTGPHILLDIATEFNIYHSMWIIQDKKLVIKERYNKEEDINRYNKIIKYGRKLNRPITFISSPLYGEIFDLTPIFKRILIEQQKSFEYRQRKNKILDDLGFYEELIDKELDVIDENSIKINYTKFEMESDTNISFKINKNSIKQYKLEDHIDKANPPHPIEFEYIITNSTNKKQSKEKITFYGTPYEYNIEKELFKFKDCQGLDKNIIPLSGFILEDISKKEEEKKRQKDAINKIKRNETQNSELIHYLFSPETLEGPIMDYKLDTVFQTDKSGKEFIYSPNQIKAIVNALKRQPLSVIQGPPGTGKTTVITEIVLQIIHSDPDAKILITSQTNNAVDNVLDNLLEKDVPFVRLSGIRQPKVSLKKHTLEKKIQGWKKEVEIKSKQNWNSIKQKFYNSIEKECIVLKSIIEIIDSKPKWNQRSVQIEKLIEHFNKHTILLNYLSNEDELIEKIDKISGNKVQEYYNKKKIYIDWISSIRILHERSGINQKLIDSIRVFGATTNHIAAKKYRDYEFEFDYVIMDESGKATTSEALIPIVLSDKLIFVGDHRQLRPMLTANREVEKWLRNKYKQEAKILESWDDYFNRPSLFEQVIQVIDEDFKSQLDVNRRSSADQVQLTSKCFYEPHGDLPIKPGTRSKTMEHNLDLQIDSSIIFYDIGTGHKSQMNEISSSFNMVTANTVFDILYQLNKKEAVKKYSIGVITGYSAQKRKFDQLYKKRKVYNWKNVSQNLRISVVDRFQGLEEDIIIFDLVRSQQHSLGFLANDNRINVALSRQKKLLFIVGDLEGTLSAIAPSNNNEKGSIGLKEYLKMLKQEWIVNSMEQIF